MMSQNISALRHNAESGERTSEESEEEEISPWPEHQFVRYSPADQDHWADLEWSNRNGKSISRELPKDQHYPINLFGHTAKEAFTDFPEPGEDLSSGDDDFAAQFPDPRRRRRSRSPSTQPHYAVSNERHTQRDAILPSPASSTFTFNPLSTDASFYDYGYGSAAVSSFIDEEPGRRRGKQLFDDRYLPVADPPYPMGSPGDINAKPKGKQRSHSDVPNMSGLRLGVDHHPPRGTRLERGHSRGSVYSEEDEDYESRKRSRNVTSRSGKRPVNSQDDDDESPLDQSADALPSSTSPAKPTGKKRKVNRYPCPVPLCKETFTRRNDVRRHIKNAAVHRDSPEALALLGESVATGTRCQYCKADLSRSDARMRHERASACGKRTSQKAGTVS